MSKQVQTNVAGKNFWGPALWKTIHSFAASYHPSQKTAFKNFMVVILPQLLPCEVCREHLKTNLRTIPNIDEYMIDNHSLFLWTYFLHDIVNGQLGKKSPPFPAVKEAYFKGLGSECTSCMIGK